MCPGARGSRDLLSKLALEKASSSNDANKRYLNDMYLKAVVIIIIVTVIINEPIYCHNVAVIHWLKGLNGNRTVSEDQVTQIEKKEKEKENRRKGNALFSFFKLTSPIN